MLAEIAAANAAFAVIKEALNNGGELAAVAGKVSEYFGLKSQINRKVSKGSQDFWELEKIRQQEEELKELLIYQGRAGLWEDWLRFQVEEKKRREREEKEEKRKKQQRRERLYNIAVAVGVGLIGITGVGVIGLMVWVALKSS